MHSPNRRYPFRQSTHRSIPPRTSRHLALFSKYWREATHHAGTVFKKPEQEEMSIPQTPAAMYIHIRFIYPFFYKTLSSTSCSACSLKPCQPRSEATCEKSIHFIQNTTFTPMACVRFIGKPYKLPSSGSASTIILWKVRRFSPE